MEWYFYVLAILGGFLAGIINTLAGNGSAITLTILTEILQLPPIVANATNRVGIFTQSVAGSWAFYKNDKLDVNKSGVYIFPTIIGAIAGIFVSMWISNAQFKTVFSYLLILMLIVILVKPKRWLHQAEQSRSLSPFITVPAFLALGFYGGFIQMGMGVFFLAAMVLGARYTMIRANAVKVFVISIYTLLAICIFQWKGLIDWQAGLLLALGQTTGGYLTAKYASDYPQADLWAYRLLVVVIIGAVIKLFFF